MTTTALLAAGIAGTALLVVVFLVDGLTRPGYGPVRQPVSALALGSRGWVQTVSFIVCGLLIAVSAIGLHQGVGSLWLTISVAVLGLALVASGIFPMDPMRGYRRALRTPHRRPTACATASTTGQASRCSLPSPQPPSRPRRPWTVSRWPSTPQPLL